LNKGKWFVIACIPAYNEESTIAKVILETMKYVDKIIVCNDGSTDMTGEIAEKLGALVITHERNLGYGAAISDLFKEARKINADIVVTLDADGQHDPNDIPRLIKPIIEGEADIVIGSRFLTRESREEVPNYRKIGIKAITEIVKKASFEEITDAQSGFRAYNKKTLELIQLVEQGMGVSTEMLLKAKSKGLRVREVPIIVKYGKKPRRNPVIHWLDVTLSTIKFMSIRHPLIFYGIPGVIALLTALVFWIWTLQIFTTTRQIVTNIALIAIGATIVGLMLLTTAMILWVLVSLIKERS